MTGTNLDKEIHRILGLPWHELVREVSISGNRVIHGEKCSCVYECAHMIHHSHWDNLDFSGEDKWRAFGVAWEWLGAHEQFSEFLTQYGTQDYTGEVTKGQDVYRQCLDISLISPLTLSMAIVEFFKEDKP